MNLLTNQNQLINFQFVTKYFKAYMILEMLFVDINKKNILDILKINKFKIDKKSFCLFNKLIQQSSGLNDVMGFHTEILNILVSIKRAFKRIENNGRKSQEFKNHCDKIYLKIKICLLCKMDIVICERFYHNLSVNFKS